MNSSVRTLVLLAVAGGMFANPQAKAAESHEWKIDSAHTNAEFGVKHMMISTVKGNFQKVSGTAEYDGKNVKSIKVDATIDATSITTGNEDRDKHLKGSDFFDVEKYPKITFVSKKAIPAGKGKFKLQGDLTMHGVTKPVTLEVEGPSPEIKDKKGNAKVGAQASAKVNRKDFGINFGGVMDNGGALVGDDVNIDLSIELSELPAKKSSGEESEKKAASK